MRLVLISDTHNQHGFEVPEGDVLIHAGDLTLGGSLAELRDATNWLKRLPHKHKIAIAGNHDFCCEGFMKEGCEDMMQNKFFEPVHYLRDSGVTLEGVTFWGSPWQPWFYDWAFNLARGSKLAEKWAKIPAATDVLITHGPPMHILDWVGKERVGCHDLAVAVNYLHPKVHVFGHIHCAYGHQKFGVTDFYNAAIVDEAYKIANPAWVHDLNSKETDEKIVVPPPVRSDVSISGVSPSM